MTRETLDETFLIRLRPEQKQRWREAAERDRRSLAGFIRKAVEDVLDRDEGADS